MSFVKKLLSVVMFIFSSLTAIVLLGVLVDSDTTGEDKLAGVIILSIIGSLLFLIGRWLWGSEMSFVKKLLAVVLFMFSFLAAIVLLGVLVDSDITGEDKLFGGIFFLVISSLSFLMGRWLWHTAKVSVPLNLIEITDSVIGDSVTEELELSTASKSLLNLLIIKRASMILSIISGIVTLYIYFHPYRLALSRMGESAPWLEPVCTVASLWLASKSMRDPGFCRAIGTPIFNAMHRSAIEEKISFWQGWLFFLAVVFCLTLVVAFLPGKTVESSVGK